MLLILMIYNYFYFYSQTTLFCSLIPKKVFECFRNVLRFTIHCHHVHTYTHLDTSVRTYLYCSYHLKLLCLWTQSSCLSFEMFYHNN